MKLILNDGYTLEKTTETTYKDSLSGQYWENLPVVTFRYRPALNEALYDHNHNQSIAISGLVRLMNQSRLIANHIVSWDVEDAEKPGKVVPIIPGEVARIPPPIFSQIWETIITWAPANQSAAEKNSGRE